MGLDMYLTAQKYLYHSEYAKEENVTVEQIASLAGLPVPDGGCTVSVTIGYWRKANAVHDWFVREVQDNVDNCGEYYVSRDRLKELRDLCEEIIKDPEDAKNILPTKSGFFFGSTDYDDWYFDDVKRTLAILDKALAMDESISFYYHSSW